MTEENINSPGVAVVFWIIAGVGICLGLLGLYGGIEDRSAVEIQTSVVGLFGSLIFVAIGSVIDRLHRIERHLRSDEKAKASNVPIPSIL